MRTTTILTLVLILATGCSTPLKKIDANAWARDYYAQQRTGDLITLEGTNMSITMTGVSKFKLASQLPPITVIPREPTWWDSASQVIPTLGMAWMGVSAINRGPTVVNPVSQPTQVIEQPVVVK